MSNETKWDVFEELLDAYDDVKSSNGNLHPTQELLDYEDRYDAALPDDLPVIPKDVAYVIEQAKKGDYKLGWVFNATYLGLWRVSVGNWIRTHADTFARAWLDGIWRIEETGEIVKLEAEK